MSVDVGEEGDSLPGREGGVWVTLREVDLVFVSEEVGSGSEGGPGKLVPATVPVPVEVAVTDADTDLVPVAVLVLELVMGKVEKGALSVSDREGVMPNPEAVVSGFAGVPTTGKGAKGSPALSSRNGVADTV